MSFSKKRKVNHLSNLYLPNNKRSKISQSIKGMTKYNHDSCYEIQNYETWDKMFCSLKLFFYDDNYNYNITDKNIIKMITEYSVGNIYNCGNCLKELLIIKGVNNQFKCCNQCNNIYYCNDNCISKIKCNNCNNIYCNINHCFTKMINKCDICLTVNIKFGCINCGINDNLTKCDSFYLKRKNSKQLQTKDVCNNHVCSDCEFYCYLCDGRICKDCAYACLACQESVCVDHFNYYMDLCENCDEERSW